MSLPAGCNRLRRHDSLQKVRILARKTQRHRTSASDSTCVRNDFHLDRSIVTPCFYLLSISGVCSTLYESCMLASLFYTHPRITNCYSAEAVRVASTCQDAGHAFDIIDATICGPGYSYKTETIDESAPSRCVRSSGGSAAQIPVVSHFNTAMCLCSGRPIQTG